MLWRIHPWTALGHCSLLYHKALTPNFRLYLSPCYCQRQCDFNHEALALNFTKTSSVGDPVAKLGHLSFLSPDVLTLLERQVQKRDEFLMWRKRKRKKVSFPKQFKSDYNLNSSGKMINPIADEIDSIVPLPFWSNKEKSKELPVHPLYS